MKKFNYGFLLTLHLMLAIAIVKSTYGQTQTLKGRVTDEKNTPIAGVSVSIVGTLTGTTTDEDGNYTLSKLMPDAVIVFSSVGHQQQSITVGDRSELNVKLLSTVTDLDQVVVIGYGSAKKRDLTGAVASIKAERLENEHPAAMQDLLRANIAGLNIGFDASPKAAASLEVRGKNTLNANAEPLVVLDGAIYYGVLADINPNDIETIDVLKDASAAAVYGAKAANGVIQLTTKKGKSGKPSINANVSTGYATMSVNQKVYGPEDFLNVWRRNARYSTVKNARPYEFDDPRTLPPSISVEQWLAYDPGVSPTADPVTVWLQRLNLQPVEIKNYKEGHSQDWYDMVFRNGFRQDYNLSVSGRKEGLNYFWSLGYMNNNGIITYDNYNIIRTRVNLEAKIAKFLTVGTSTQFSVRDESAVPVDWTLIRSNSPWGSFYNDDSTDYRYIPNDETTGGRNPFSVPKYTNRLTRYYTLNSSLFAKVNLPFNIKYQALFTPRFEWYNYFNGQSSKYQEWANVGGYATRENMQVYQWQIDNIVSWSKDFNRQHHLDVTLLANAEKLQKWQNKIDASGFLPSDVLSYHNLGAAPAANTTVSSNDEYSTGDALMARLFYSFKNRYMITGTVRRDGYSAFGQANPRATFPSLALGWVFSDEKFAKSDWLNYGKLRVSYGKNGNRDIPRYAALSDLQTGKYLHVLPDGTVVQVSQLYVNNMQNKMLKWETTTALNVGLDFTLFNNKVGGSIEVYKSSTKDLLVQRTLPPFLGFSYVWDNLGQVDNKGIEFSINTKNITNNKFAWNTTFNFSLNRNKIVHLYGNMVDVTDADGKVTGKKEADDINNKWFIGHSTNAIWDQRVLGVWQVTDSAAAAKYGVYPGDFRIKDVNNDGKYTNDDKEFLGFTSPRFRWSMRNEFVFNKSFTFSFLMYSYLGHMDTYNQAKNRSVNYPDRVNSYILPFWTPQNPTNDYARIASSDGSASYSVYRRKSFVRIDNVAMGYTLPARLVSKYGIGNLKVYFTIKNAGVFAPDWKFWDPENSGPTPRIYTLGLNTTL